MPELYLRPLAIAGGGHIGLGFVVQSLRMVVRPHLQSIKCVSSATIQQDPGFGYQEMKRSKVTHLYGVILEVRVIKRWLVGHVHAVYDVSIWALLNLQFANN
jgi:hypothetical protein